VVFAGGATSWCTVGVAQGGLSTGRLLDCLKGYPRVLAVLSGEGRQEVGRLHLQRHGKAHNVVQGRVLLATLDAPEVGAGDAGLQGQPFL